MLHAVCSLSMDNHFAMTLLHMFHFASAYSFLDLSAASSSTVALAVAISISSVSWVPAPRSALQMPSNSSYLKDQYMCD